MLDQRGNLKGKCAIVTGGAGGIGYAITEALAGCGTNVAICDRDKAALRRAESELVSHGVHVFAAEADVREPDQLAAFFATFDRRFGAPDIVVIVPGGLFHADFMETNRRGWDAIIRANFLHLLDTTHHAVERMLRAGHTGSIVFITSIEGLRGMPGGSVYGAMKAAVESFTRSLAVELAPHGIRVNTVAPDMIPTEATVALGSFPPDESDARPTLSNRMMIPMGRKGTTAEVANAVLFLASDLSSYSTGSTILVDGGTFAASSWVRWPTKVSNRVPDEVADALLESQHLWLER